MITAKIEDYLIKEVFEISQRAILTPANLGIFKKGSNENIIEVLDQVDVNQLVQFNSVDDYDKWFDEVVSSFHHSLYPLYRENLVISMGNPYSYSARLLTQYLKYLSTKTIAYCTIPNELILMIHPIISNQYLKHFPDLEIRMVNQIKSGLKYYEIVDHYRTCMDMDMCELNKAILEMDFGIDV